MARKIAFWLLWIGLITYAFIFAPPDHPDTLALIQKLSTGQWDNINPLVVSLFNLMGVWPFLYSCVLLIDGRSQKIPAWPFALGSFFVGAFALLPYLALREPGKPFVGDQNSVLKLLDSRWLGIILTIGATVLLYYGLSNGNWSDFVQQWQANRFIHVMSWDFCLLCLLFPTLLGDDMTRRGLNDQRLFWLVSLLPLIGPLLYLSLRPSLASQLQASPQKTLNSEIML